MHEAQPQHPLFGRDPHALKRADGVEIAAPRHDPALGQRFGQRRRRAPRIQRHGGRTVLGPVRPEQANRVPGRQVIQQRLQQPRLVPAHQVMHPLGPRGRAARDAVMRGQRVDVIRHAGAGRDLRMIGPRRGEPLVQRARVEIVPLVRQRLAQRAADHHDPLMRAIGLVGREKVDVRPHQADIGKAVRRIADPVDADEGPGGMGQGGDLDHRVDLPHHVRAMRKAYQPHAVVQQPLQVRRVQRAGLGVDAPLAQLDAAFGQAAPGAAVGLMVLVGDDDGLARLHPLAKGLGQHIGVGRGRGAETDLVALDPHQRGQAAAGLVHLLAAQAAGVIGAVGLHLALVVEPRQPLDHRTAGVGTARVLEKRLPLERGFGNGRELRADEIDVEHGHRCGPPRPACGTVLSARTVKIRFCNGFAPPWRQGQFPFRRSHPRRHAP